MSQSKQQNKTQKTNQIVHPNYSLVEFVYGTPVQTIAVTLKGLSMTDQDGTPLEPIPAYLLSHNYIISPGERNIFTNTIRKNGWKINYIAKSALLEAEREKALNPKITKHSHQEYQQTLWNDALRLFVITNEKNIAQKIPEKTLEKIVATLNKQHNAFFGKDVGVYKRLWCNASGELCETKNNEFDYTQKIVQEFVDNRSAVENSIEEQKYQLNNNSITNDTHHRNEEDAANALLTLKASLLNQTAKKRKKGDGTGTNTPPTYSNSSESIIPQSEMFNNLSMHSIFNWKLKEVEGIEYDISGNKVTIETNQKTIHTQNNRYPTSPQNENESESENGIAADPISSELSEISTYSIKDKSNAKTSL